ncbi:MAG: TlpA family protein disulfide reductase [Acidobacteria bacterium]|nr:TlpA family protein disulfide reductase [Acidobacteriota bacterium]
MATYNPGLMRATAVTVRVFGLLAALLILSGHATPVASPDAPPSTGRESSRDSATSVPEAALAPASPADTRASEGIAFPPIKVSALLPGADAPATLDLAADLGQRTIVFAYFLPGYQVSEGILADVRDFVRSGPGKKVALYAVTRVAAGQPVAEMTGRLKALRLDVPVILDQDARVQRTLGVAIVPAISLVDSKGVFCFTGASSLKQEVFKGIAVKEAILMSSRGEDPPAVFGMERYYPVADFIGSKLPDISLPEFGTAKSVSLTSFVGPGHVTAIFYWGPHCDYSRHIMPQIVLAQKTYHPKYLNVVSVATLKEGATAEDLRKYEDEAGIGFPVLEDAGRAFTSKLRVVSTPTLIIVRPDGVIDSVYNSDKPNFFAVLSTKVNTLAVKAGAAKPR